MKLYKNTLKYSVVVFFACVFLSFVFEFSCLSKLNIVSFLSDYMIGIACSIVVVIITTYLQFKYEQEKTLKSILSNVHFFFFDYLLIVLSLDPDEETPDKLWEYYYDETYNGIKKISSELSNLEWFSKTKSKTSGELQIAVLSIMTDMVKASGRSNREGLSQIIDNPMLRVVKNKAILLADSHEYYKEEIIKNYEQIQEELDNLKTKKSNMKI